jgi:rhodanese-related sulfurtransferase
MTHGPAIRPSIDRVLARARRKLDRLTPAQAMTEQSLGALLIDIRNQEQRHKGGTIPGAIAIDRTVLEWRCDPTSPWRMNVPIEHDTRMILICAQGYSSSLAAASLKGLGLWRATDVIGGFEAWVRDGLPVAGARSGSRKLRVTRARSDPPSVEDISDGNRA